MREISVMPERCANILRRDNKKVSLAMDDIIPPEYNPIPDNYFDEVIRRVTERSEELSRPFEPVTHPMYRKIKPPVTEKRCTRCKNIKPVSEFTPRYNHSFTSWCRACQSENRRNHYDTDKAYEQHVRATYGLSQEQYQAMYEAQDGRCASCRSRPSHRSRMDIDHDHTTGKVRGLLCHGCNIALGLLKEDHKRIHALSRYLKRFDERKPVICVQPALFIE